MFPDGFAARDFTAPDLLPPDLIDATPPGSFQLLKGPSALPVAVLIEFDVETG